MQKVKFILPCFLIAAILLTACSANQSTADTGSSAGFLAVSSAVQTASGPNSISSEAPVESKSSSSKSVPDNASKSENSTAASVPDNAGIALKTKDYLLRGQNNKPEVQKLNWSEAFLNQTDLDSVYQKYISAGGKEGDVKAFAEYLTKNAPVLKNWKELFEAALLKTYGEKASRYESLPNDFYQVYVKKNGSEVPFVVVNARTGYYHG